MRVNFKKILYSLVFFLAFIVFYQGIVYAGNNTDNPLEVVFLDVGQGDAVLINYLNDKQILIDAGKNGKEVVSEIKKQMPHNDDKIEIIIATHPDMDHIGGMDEVLSNYKTDLFLDNGFKDDGEQLKKVERILNQKQISQYSVFEGSTIDLGKHLSFKAYNPDNKQYSKSDKNGDSVVLRMDFGKNSFLFTGDIGKETEGDILDDEEDVDVDWLKVAHHGSKNSSSNEFIEETSPEFSIISVGANNTYGHPHPEVLQKLKNSSSRIFSTAKEETIKVACPGIKRDCFLVD
ncbi:MAG: ComEC/Rec2 family competence protein [Candidatus Moraniibacteriota bacterium]